MDNFLILLKDFSISQYVIPLATSQFAIADLLDNRIALYSKSWIIEEITSPIDIATESLRENRISIKDSTSSIVQENRS